MPEGARASGNRDGGVFSNLIPKMGAIADLEDTIPDAPKFIVSEIKEHTPQIASNDAFFELDVSDDEPVASPFGRSTVPVTNSPLVNTPTVPSVVETPVRKVNPYEIPAGHVDLGDGYKQSNFAPEIDLSDPDGFVGRTVKGRYKVVEFLGSDETGLAFIADDKLVEDKKVLVRIFDASEPDDIIDSMLAEESISLSHLSHPNIARLIDSGEFSDGTNFLISEYVEALSVDDILGIHGYFNAERAGRVIRQAANGLNEAHQEGILHRDIRAENLIIDTGDGETEITKLCNFGTSDGRPTEQNVGYKAPEILDGRVATIASDVFSLAVVAYEMLTGRMPFEGESLKAISRAQQAGLTLKPTDVRPDLPNGVDTVLSKALSYNPADRFAKAREFGDAFYAAISEPQLLKPAESTTEVKPAVRPGIINIRAAADTGSSVAVAAATTPIKVANEPWRNRSPEPPEVGTPRTKWIFGIGILLLLVLLVFGWYFLMRTPVTSDVPSPTTQGPEQSGLNNGTSPITTDTEMPPQPRNIPQPPDTNYYQNTKQNLKGDLLLNFVGFTLYYPKDWKVNGPKEAVGPNLRGKFLDISHSTADDRLKEQMLVSYYPSKGTFSTDAEKFPQMVKETNETLKKILPGYQVVSEGEIKLNGDWKAYEVKFQGGGTSASGEKLVVWGRRLFIPAARPGVRNGFEITMLATSLAEEVQGVDDVGVKGRLAGILYSFEPSQNF